MQVRAILRQEEAWFEAQLTGQLTTALEQDCQHVQIALGSKVRPPSPTLFLVDWPIFRVVSS